MTLHNFQDEIRSQCAHSPVGSPVTAGVELSPRPETFSDRFNAPSNHNTLQIERNCATCMTGIAPQVLSHLKIACLSYVNQPVDYAGFKLSFAEVMQVKEYLLVQTQSAYNQCHNVLAEHESRFGLL